MHELSVVFLTYNADIGSVKESLRSIISQKAVDFEIVIADDGSEDNLKAEIEEFFRSSGFSDYKLVLNPENAGTVGNLLSGLTVAEGEFAKTLSPGDRLYSDDTMRKWLDFMKGRDQSWSFSDAVYYYKDEDGKDIIISGEAHPQDIKPYVKEEKSSCRWNYVVLQDIPVGATLLSKTDIQTEYCRRIKEAGVKYAEDNMWRLMMFEGEDGTYYPEKTVLYECAGGISAPGSDLWKQRLRKDWKTTDGLMHRTSAPDTFQRDMLNAIREDQNALQKLLIKGKLRLKVKRIISKRKTQC